VTLVLLEEGVEGVAGGGAGLEVLGASCFTAVFGVAVAFSANLQYKIIRKQQQQQQQQQTNNISTLSNPSSEKRGGKDKHHPSTNTEIFG